VSLSINMSKFSSALYDTATYQGRDMKQNGQQSFQHVQIFLGLVRHCNIPRPWYGTERTTKFPTWPDFPRPCTTLQHTKAVIWNRTDNKVSNMSRFSSALYDTATYQGRDMKQNGQQSFQRFNLPLEIVKSYELEAFLFEKELAGILNSFSSSLTFLFFSCRYLIQHWREDRRWDKGKRK
jgi:hypothetical protein